jgi:hypothetical protein
LILYEFNITVSLKITYICDSQSYTKRSFRSYSHWTFHWWIIDLFFCPIVWYRRNLRKSKEVDKVGLFFVSFDLYDSSGTVSGKDLFGHTFTDLFFDAKLDYFFLIYHSIGEISGIFKILRKDSGEESGQEIFLEILKPKSFRI